MSHTIVKAEEGIGEIIAENDEEEYVILDGDNLGDIVIQFEDEDGNAQAQIVNSSQLVIKEELLEVVQETHEQSNVIKSPSNIKEMPSLNPADPKDIPKLVPAAKKRKNDNDPFDIDDEFSDVVPKTSKKEPVKKEVLSALVTEGPVHHHRCPICKKNFLSARGLQGHFTASHRPEDADFMCGICNEPYNEIIKLEEHYQSVHNSSLRKNIMKQPKIKSTTSKASGSSEPVTMLRYTCENCDKAFDDLETFHAHQRSLSPCHICERIFCTVGGLQRHFAMTHPEDDCDLRCGLCSKSYATMDKLKEHYSVDHGV